MDVISDFETGLMLETVSKFVSFEFHLELSVSYDKFCDLNLFLIVIQIHRL